MNGKESDLNKTRERIKKKYGRTCEGERRMKRVLRRRRRIQRKSS
jgi:hypothetical protein